MKNRDKLSLKIRDKGAVLGAVDGRTELLLYFTPVVVSQFIIIGCVIFAIIINCGAPLSYS